MKVATVLALVAVLGVASVAMAQDANAPARDPNMRPLMGQVVSVAADGNVVVKPRAGRGGADVAEVTVATDTKTVVTVDGKDAKVADLKKDLYVVVTPAKGVATKIVATTEAPARGRRGGAGGAAPATN
jgi:hypothetical protein